MRLPRMTTRRWMIVAAVVALTFGGYRLKHERDWWLAMATGHANQEAYFRRVIEAYTIRCGATRRRGASGGALCGARARNLLERSNEYSAPQQGGQRDLMETIVPQGHCRHPDRPITAEKYLEILRWHADHHAELARKYRAAASRPWLPVEPRPTEARNESFGIQLAPMKCKPLHERAGTCQASSIVARTDRRGTMRGMERATKS